MPTFEKENAKPEGASVDTPVTGVSDAKAFAEFVQSEVAAVESGEMTMERFKQECMEMLADMGTSKPLGGLGEEKQGLNIAGLETEE